MKLYRGHLGSWPYFFPISSLAGVTGEPGSWRAELVNGKTIVLSDAEAVELIGRQAVKPVASEPPPDGDDDAGDVDER